jgi:general secretion pathway protein K
MTSLHAKSSNQARDRQGGFALVVVLWIVTVLALQVSLFNLSVRDAASLASNELAILRGEALATAGVEVAAARMLARDPAQRWRADGSVRQIALGDALVEIAIRDEAARIDINEADAELLSSMLQRFVRNPRTVAQWVDRIMDWRDPDSDPRPQGAEELDYRRAGLPYGPSNGPMLDPSELTRILDFSPAVAQALASHLTVFGGDGGINPQLATRETLLLLPGAEASTVERIMELRQRGEEGARAATAELGPSAKWLTARRGPAYRIEVAVRGNSEPAIGTAEAVVLIGKDAQAPFHILSWRYEPRMWVAQGGAKKP